jgi:hypothetical protein
MSIGTIAVDLALVDKFNVMLDKFKGDVTGGIKSFAAGLVPGLSFAAVGSKLAADLYGGISRAAANEKDIKALNEDIKLLGSTLSGAQIEQQLSGIGDRVASDADDLRKVFNQLRQIMGKDVGAQMLLDLLPGMKAFQDRGIGMEQSAQAIGMAMQGATRGLKQFGITLAEGSSKADVFDALSKRFAEMGPLAEANAATLEGMAARIKIAYEDAFEAFGAGFNASMGAMKVNIGTFSADIQASMKTIGESLGRTFSAAGPLITWAIKIGAKAIEEFSVKIETLGQLFNASVEAMRWGFEALKTYGKLAWNKLSEEFVNYYNTVAGSAIGEVLGLEMMKASEGSNKFLEQVGKQQLAGVSDAIGSYVSIAAKAAERIQDIWTKDKPAAGAGDSAEDEKQRAARAERERLNLQEASNNEKAVKSIEKAGVAAAAKVREEVMRGNDEIAKALGAEPSTRSGQASKAREEQRYQEDLQRAGRSFTKAQDALGNKDIEGYNAEMARYKQQLSEANQHKARMNPELGAYGDAVFDAEFRGAPTNKSAAKKTAGAPGGYAVNDNYLESGKEQVYQAIERMGTKFNDALQNLATKIDTIAPQLS